MDAPLVQGTLFLSGNEVNVGCWKAMVIRPVRLNSLLPVYHLLIWPPPTRLLLSVAISSMVVYLSAKWYVAAWLEPPTARSWSLSALKACLPSKYCTFSQYNKK